MKRILIAECKQEVSTFNPDPSDYNDFIIRRGEEILRYHRDIGYEVGGALGVFDAEPDIEVVPTYSALSITSCGSLTASSWKRLAGELLESLRSAPKADGVYFCLHGAMCAETESDPEGYLLQEARRILGEDIPIVASLDLHGILTNRMLELCDAVVPYHTYPHVDFRQTGERAARLLLRILRGEARPVTAKVDIPALVRGDELITETGLFGRNIRAAEAFEQSPAGLAAGMFIGNPFTDVPELRTYSVATANADAPAAERAAMSMAREFWENHERMQVPLVSLDEMVGIAKEPRSGTLGLVDAADATSSGASGDGNIIIRRLRDAGYTGRVLAPLVDAPAVERAVAAGVGATLTTAVGGTLDTGRFQPWEITAKVRLLSDGRIRSESFGGHWYSGPTAVLESDGLTLVVTSRAVHLYDRSLFFAHGQDPRHFDAVVIKSPHCQHHMYAAWCARMVNVDAPGSTSANLRSLGHTRCPRPIFPLDAHVPFSPVARIFQRPRYRS
ncbi:MAG: M81 family metallopeptidase [Opitutaceae bacterium]|nr:M81 family metallopeptidase [Opitutaceae bacterium]